MKKNNNNILEYLLMIFVIFMPFFIGKDIFLLNMLIMSGINIILTTSLRLCFITGIWNMGQAAFYSIGAYSIVFLMKGLNISYWLGIIISPLISCIIALIIGFIVLRVKGIYFAILSMSFVEVVRLTYINIRPPSEITMRSLPPDPIFIKNFFKIDFTSDRIYYYYLILVFVIITILILKNIEKSQLGKILIAIEKNETLTASFGVNTYYYKIIAFCISSFFAGLAGALFAAYNIIVTPTTFTIWSSMMLIVLMVVGGMKSTYGPVLGSIILTILPRYLPFDQVEQKIIYGILLILIILLLPKGLISLPEELKKLLFYKSFLKNRTSRN